MFLALLLSRNVYLTIGLNTLGGFLTGGRIMVGYIYMMEILTPKYKLPVATLFNVGDALNYLAMTFYFDYVSNNYLYFI